MGVREEHTNKSAELVQQVRDRFIEDYENNKGLYVEEDVDRIRDSDWFVKRFLLARGRNADNAFIMMRDAMRWRKEIGISIIKDSEFPLEFYKIGGLFSYERDRKGNVVIYMRIRMHRKIPELADPIKLFLMNILNKVDLETDGNGMAIVFDLTGAGYTNVDLEFLSFLLNAGNSYFPVGLKYILVYELPWVLTPFRKVAMALVPKNFLQFLKFANKKDVTDYIAPENLPDYMGGTCRRNYRAVPRDCPSVFKLAKAYGYGDEIIAQFLPHFEPFLKEADKALASGNFIDPPGFGQSDDDNNQNNEKMESDKNPSIVSIKTSINHNQGQSNLLGIFPNDVILFEYDAYSNAFSSYVILQNISNSAVAFKVQSNNPNSYFVTPRLGIIHQNATLKFNIQLREGFEHQIRDKFLILSLPITQSRLSADEFSKVFNNSKSDIVAYKLCSNINYNNNSNDTSETAEISNDFNSQILSLTQWCQKLEKRQKRLSFVINSMIFIIILLVLFLIISVNYSDNMTVNSIKTVVKEFVKKNTILAQNAFLGQNAAQ